MEAFDFFLSSFCVSPVRLQTSYPRRRRRSTFAVTLFSSLLTINLLSVWSSCPPRSSSVPQSCCINETITTPPVCPVASLPQAHFQAGAVPSGGGVSQAPLLLTDEGAETAADNKEPSSSNPAEGRKNSALLETDGWKRKVQARGENSSDPSDVELESETFIGLSLISASLRLFLHPLSFALVFNFLLLLLLYSAWLLR